MAKLLYIVFLFLVYVSASKGITVKPGDDVTLHCHGPRDADIKVLEWIRPDLSSEGYVFFYREQRNNENYQHPLYRGRVELKDPEVKNGDVSVILKNVTINDAGRYECKIKINNTVRDTELINNITLNVVEPGHSEEGGDKDRNSMAHIGLVVGLSVVVVLVAGVVGFVIYRKQKAEKKQNPNQPPVDEAAEAFV